MCRDCLKKAFNSIEHAFFPKNRKTWITLYAFFIFLFISGCASAPFPQIDPISINQFPAYLTPDNTKIFPEEINETVPDVDILAINQDIKKLINKKVRKIRDPRKRLEMLAELLVEKTAQETFDTGTGNCLSFSNLFVATARYAGFNSVFSEIPTRPNWIRDSGIIFLTRHMGASVDIRNVFTQAIQLENSEDSTRLVTLGNSVRYYFSPSELGPEGFRTNPFNYYSISDQRAFAQHYNNLGSKYLAEGKNEDAFRYFVKAIKTEPRLSFAWSNLGALYRKNNQTEAAEKAYFQGLSVSRGIKDTSTLTIMNNLANLYDIIGQKEKALFYKEKVAAFREKNPYYKYEMGKSAFNNKEFKKSIGYFKDAIRLKNDEHLFYYNIALSYFKTGNMKKARLNINNAIKYSWDENRKDYYKKIYSLFIEEIDK